MDIIKRGATRIIRNLLTSVILLIIVFILGSIIAGSVSIFQAASNAEASLSKKQMPIAAIGYNPEPEISEVTESTQLTVDTIEEISTLPYVKEYDYSSTNYLVSNKLQKYIPENTDSGIFSNTLGLDEEYSDFKLYGTNFPEPLNLRQNKIKLISGRYFTQNEIENLSYVIIVPVDFAERNNLELGSKISLQKPIQNHIESGTEILAIHDYEFEIIGIYEKTEELLIKDPMDLNSQYWVVEQKNTFYTTNTVLNQVHEAYLEEFEKLEENLEESHSLDEEISYTPVYILNSINDLEKFREEVTPMISNYFAVIDNYSSIQEAYKPLESLKQFAQIILIISVSASVIFLCLFTAIFMSKRKHEIKVYLTLGERKTKIILQVLLEMILVVVIAITLSLFTGNLISSGLSEKMLGDQIVSQQQKEDETESSASFDQMSQMGYDVDISSEDIQKAYSVKLNFSTVSLFYLIFIGIIIISSSISVIYIIRFNYKKIMQ